MTTSTLLISPAPMSQPLNYASAIRRVSSASYSTSGAGRGVPFARCSQWFLKCSDTTLILRTLSAARRSCGARRAHGEDRTGARLEGRTRLAGHGPISMVRVAACRVTSRLVATHPGTWRLASATGRLTATLRLGDPLVAQRIHVLEGPVSDNCCAGDVVTTR